MVFEAVDYEATVFVNDVEVGSHTGGISDFSVLTLGYDSFSFDTGGRGADCEGYCKGSYRETGESIISNL